MKSLDISVVILLFLFSFFSVNVVAQFENTVKMDSTSVSPAASLETLNWIAGSWEGEAMGARAEEIWSTPSGSSMMGMFKLYTDEIVLVYELMTIRQTGSTILLQLKHFDDEMKGWEEKEETEDFHLVKIEENKIYFDGLTFEKISDTAINVYVIVGNKSGDEAEEKFEYHRRK